MLSAVLVHAVSRFPALFVSTFGGASWWAWAPTPCPGQEPRLLGAAHLPAHSVKSKHAGLSFLQVCQLQSGPSRQVQQLQVS